METKQDYATSFSKNMKELEDLEKEYAKAYKRAQSLDNKAEKLKSKMRKEAKENWEGRVRVGDYVEYRNWVYLVKNINFSYNAERNTEEHLTCTLSHITASGNPKKVRSVYESGIIGNVKLSRLAVIKKHEAVEFLAAHKPSKSNSY